MGGQPAAERRSAPARRLVAGFAAVVALAGVGWAKRSAWRPAGPPPSPVAPPRVPARSLAGAGMPLPEACRAAGVRFPPPQPRVVVRKAERILGLYAGDTLLKEYPVGLGRRPLPDKEREGDGCTPVGEFTVCTRLEQSRFYRFLGLSYPDPEHARRALATGRITRRQAEAIERAHQRGQTPPWNTPLGGEVGIHGGGSGIDWTLGCIALDNEAVDELSPVLEIGTPVRIE
jgi:L,D-transpeptidase catalytic domain